VTVPGTTDRPASGSLAVRELVGGASRRVSVLAVFPRAVYLADARAGAPPRVVLTLVTSDGIAHPGSLVLTVPAAQRPFARLAAGDTVEVGRGRVRLDRTLVRVTRWWRPRPALRPTTAADLRDRRRQLRTVLVTQMGSTADDTPGASDLQPRFDVLLAALRDGRGPASRTAVDALLGRGPGLTPGGDDLCAGLLAGVPLLAAAVAGGSAPDGREAARRRALVAATGALGQHVLGRAPDATTAISANLLRHAAVGELAAPAAGFLHALTGRADPGAAAAGLLAVGATSGRELATGLLAAADLVAPDRVAAARVAARGSAAAVGAIQDDPRSADADGPVDVVTRRTDR
jgi:hypothetical protein